MTPDTPAQPAVKELRCNNCACRDLPIFKSIPISKDRVKRYRRCRHCGVVKISTEKDGPIDGQDG